MTKVSQIVLGTLITLGSIVIPVPEAKASVHQEHVELWRTLQEVGVTTLINEPSLCHNEKADGAYFYTESTLIVCQDNSHRFGTKEVTWTANDYDTLRHEAHHVIQDCLVGGIADGKLGRLFSDIDELKEFVFNALTEEQVKAIVTQYRESGADDDVILRELEAFAVATSVDARNISEGLRDVCL